MNQLLNGLAFIGLLLSTVYVHAQSIKFKPTTPEAGKSLTLIYTPIEGYQNDKIYAYVYVISDQEPVLVDGILQKKGKNFQGKINLPVYTKAIYIYFYQDDYLDNNYQKGYTAITRGNEATGNILLLAEKIRNEQNWSPNTFFPDLDNFTQTNQQLYQSKWNFAEWLAYYDVKNHYDENFELEQRMAILTKLLDQAATPRDAKMLKNKFNQIGENNYNKRLDSLVGVNSTVKSPAQIKVLRSITQAWPMHKKLANYNQYMDTLSDHKHTASFNNELQNILIQEYMSAKKYDTVMDLLSRFQSHEQVSRYAPRTLQAYLSSQMKSTTQNPRLESDKNDNKQSSFKNKNHSSIDKVEAFIQSTQYFPIQREPLENIVSYNNRKKRVQQNMELLNAIKEKEMGLSFNALSIYQKIFDQQILPLNEYANDYIQLLLDHQQFKSLESIWRRLWLSNQGSPKLDQTIQALAQQNLLSFQDFEAEKDKINQEIVLNEAQLISKKLSKVKAPDFKLVDDEGNEVSLASLKGKKVMIDFWATWCTFCKSSFPEIKKIQEYYKENDPNVKFVFIQTMERGNQENKKREGNQYLKDNNFPFYNLYDDPTNLYAKKFYLNSIPAKIFIDPEGNFVYKSIGFRGGYEKNLAEFKVIFDSMDKK